MIGAIIGAAVDVTAQVLVAKLNGKSWSDAVSNIDYKEVGVAAVAGFVTSGVSALYSDAAAAGTNLVLSKGASGAIAGAAVSVLNQANDAEKKGEPLSISPVTMAKDILTDGVADHLSEKIPEVKINGSDASNLNGAIKTTAGDAMAKGVDVVTDLTKPGATKLAPIQLGISSIVSKVDATANKIYVPKLKNK